MHMIFHTAESRGYADHGWLVARHSFSFANFYHPEKINFGALRVFNDDTIAPGKGFPEHPHDNMEIVTIPLSGSLAHRDSMGNSSVIQSGEIQVMSAGTGIFHSEYNNNNQNELNLFQIWIFPNKKNVTPRYQQIKITDIEKENTLFQVLSPKPDQQGVWIYQNAWFYMGKYTEDHKENYQFKKNGDGVYIMNINGELTINEHNLKSRDGIGIWDTSSIEIEIKPNTQFLLIEIPMDKYN